jgi:acetyltransferase-like isoleucine patch superfamily enzyme
MEPGSRIGAFNLIKIRRLVMRHASYLGAANILKGRFSCCLARNAAIGNRNFVGLGNLLSAHPPVLLKLGTWAKITASHYVNVEESIKIGEYSTIAGAGSQLWTHGYVHMSSGLDRAEVRGRITIGSNVYIGAHSCIGPGITIVDRVAVGAHSSVATSLERPGVYVSQPLRYVPSSGEERIAKLEKVELGAPGDGYYWRNGGGPPRGTTREIPQ